MVRSVSRVSEGLHTGFPDALGLEPCEQEITDAFCHVLIVSQSENWKPRAPINAKNVLPPGFRMHNLMRQ